MDDQSNMAGKATGGSSEQVCGSKKKWRKKKCQDRGLNTGPSEHVTSRDHFSLLLSQLSYPGDESNSF